MKKEYNVGEIFEYKNAYLEVFREINGRCCENCSLFLTSFLDNTRCLPCISIERTDNENVFYKFISKNEVKKLKINKLNL